MLFARGTRLLSALRCCARAGGAAAGNAAASHATCRQPLLAACSGGVSAMCCSVRLEPPSPTAARTDCAAPPGAHYAATWRAASRDACIDHSVDAKLAECANAAAQGRPRPRRARSDKLSKHSACSSTASTVGATESSTQGAAYADQTGADCARDARVQRSSKKNRRRSLQAVSVLHADNTFCYRGTATSQLRRS